MSVWGKVAVAGAYEHPTRFAPDKTAFQIHAESARGALEDAGLRLQDVDALFTSGVGPIGIMSLANHLDLRPIYMDSQAIGGSSFVSHCLHATAAIAAGLCRVALVTYGSTAASERFAIGTGGGFVADPRTTSRRRSGRRSWARTRWSLPATCTSTAPRARSSPRLR